MIISLWHAEKRPVNYKISFTFLSFFNLFINFMLLLIEITKQSYSLSPFYLFEIADLF